MNKIQLLKLIGAFIRASDADLVDNQSCFPCPKDQHENYKAIRDCFKKIYEEADFTLSQAFKDETKGKSLSYITMRTKLISSPKKRDVHKKNVLEQLCDLSTIYKAINIININHHNLYTKAISNLNECKDA